MASGRARDTLWTAALVLAVSFFFLDLLLGRNLYIRDIQRSYVPDRAALSRLLSLSELPYWNHFIAAGQPLAANPAYELFYPPQWLMAIGDLRDMLHLEVVLHYALAAAGIFLLIRAFGAAPIAAAFGGFSYALGGAMLSFGSFFPFLFSAAWLPWIALFFHRHLDSGRVRDLALTALALGMLILVADVSMILQSGALLTAYAAWCAWRSGNWRRAITAVVLVVVFAIGVGAAQIFPAMDHQRDSGRDEAIPLPEATRWSMPLVRPLEMIWPALFGSPSEHAFFFWSLPRLYPKEQFPFFLHFYPGIAASVLVMAGFLLRIRGSRFVALVCVVAWLLAIGSHGFLFDLIYGLGLRSLRYPEKFFVSAIFVLAVFAGIAADEALRNARLRRVGAIIGGAITLATLLILATTLLPDFAERFADVWGLRVADADYAARFQRGMLFSATITAVVTIALALERLAPRARVLIIVLAVAADLGSRVDRLVPRIDPSFYTPPPAARQLAREPMPVRIYSHADWQRLHEPQEPVPIGIRAWTIRNGLLPSTQITWGFEGAVDPDPTLTKLKPSAEFERLFRATHINGRGDRMPLLLQMSGATHVGLLREPDPAVVRNPQLFPEVDPVTFVHTGSEGPIYFATRLVGAAAAEDVGTRLFSGEALPHTTVFVAQPFPLAHGRVLSSSRHGNHVVADVEAEGTSFLALAVTRHKYWRAAIDGRPARLIPANVAFQGLVIPAGRHKVELTYFNPIVYATAWVSGAVVLMLLIAAVAGRRTVLRR